MRLRLDESTGCEECQRCDSIGKISGDGPGQSVPEGVTHKVKPIDAGEFGPVHDLGSKVVQRRFCVESCRRFDEVRHKARM